MAERPLLSTTTVCNLLGMDDDPSDTLTVGLYMFSVGVDMLLVGLLMLLVGLYMCLVGLDMFSVG